LQHRRRGRLGVLEFEGLPQTRFVDAVTAQEVKRRPHCESLAQQRRIVEAFAK
jgi:hypothetical protein